MSTPVNQSSKFALEFSIENSIVLEFSKVNSNANLLLLFKGADICNRYHNRKIAE